jgi:predicted unusual protein kinase regulating ubiquinone biosynthesis (AarF/ABC1/UbiB family)
MHLSLRPHHVGRYRQIATVLAKHSHGDLSRFGESSELDELLDESGVDGSGSAGPEDLSADLEKLGPTFVKLGQLLSSRSDLLPPDYVAALARLQDDCEPFPFADVQSILEAELGVRMSRVFPEFDSEPVAAASLGQVHRAALRDGRVVAVKVQRPGVREQLADDLEVLGELADFFEAHSDQARQFAVRDAFDQFRTALVAELDYRREASNLETLREVLRNRPCIVVPQPYRDFSTSKVLTMEYVDGRKVTELTPLARLEFDFRPLADELFGAYLDQILSAGFFHADPHPGNLLVTRDGRLALIDVGMVGRLTPETRQLLTKLMIAIMNSRSADVVRIARNLGTPQDDFDPTALQSTVDELMATMSQGPLADVDMGRAFVDLSRRSAQAGLRPAPELALLGKTLLNLEHVAAELDPEFAPLEAMRRHVPDLMRSQVDGSVGGMLSSLMEAKEFIEELPGRVNRAMDSLASGHFELRVQAFDETQFLKGLHRLANVAAAGLILAALIIGSALLASQRGSGHVVTNSIALAVFAIAVVASLGLLAWMALASRKVKARRHR